MPGLILLCLPESSTEGGVTALVLMLSQAGEREQWAVTPGFLGEGKAKGVLVAWLRATSQPLLSLHRGEHGAAGPLMHAKAPWAMD